jgi:hypothetical protein
MKYSHNTARAIGRTTDMVKLANETGAYLVVRDRNAAMRLQDVCERFPVTYSELMQDRMRGSMVRNIVIDDADALLKYILSPLTIEGISTGSEAT